MKSGKILKLLGLLCILYLLTGFFLVPLAVRHFGQKALRDNLSEQATIEGVQANPLTFQLTLTGLRIPDAAGERWIDCEEVQVDVSVATVFTFHPVLDSVRLTQPFVRIERGAPTESAEPSEASEPQQWQDRVAEMAVMEIPRFTVHELAIHDGEVIYADTLTGYEEQVQPINFTLLDFTTAKVKDNSLSFVAQTPSGAELALDGTFSIDPRTLNASVQLSGVDLSTFEPYYDELTNFSLEKAVFGLSFDLDVNLSEIENLLQLTNGQVSLNDVQARRQDDGGRLISLESISLEGIHGRFPEPLLEIDRISILNGDTLVQRDSEGQLNLLDLIVLPETTKELAAQEPAGEAAEAEPAAAFAWRVNQFELKNYVITWEDRFEGLDASLDLTIEDIALSGIEADLAKPVQASASYRIGEQGVLSLSGQFAPDGSQAALDLSVAAIELPRLTAYARQAADLDISSGALSLQGQVTREPGQAAYHFTGACALEGFAVASVDSEQLRFGWESLALEGIDLTSEPLAISIGTVRLSTPTGRFVRSATAGPSAADAEPNTEAPAEPAGPESAPLDLRIGQLIASTGEIIFRDEAVEPAVEIAIRSIEAEVKPIHLAKEATTEVQLKAEINRAPLSVEGNLAPLDPIADTKLSISLAGFNLPAMTPYSGQAVGRAIDNGTFNLDADWTINASQLSAKNILLFDGFALGDNIPSDDAISLPLDLALSLLRRQDGSIKMNLPVSGDLSDPKLSVGQLVVQAFVGLIVKTAAAPFSLLSGLVESEKDLSSVSFDPDSSQLSADTMDSLNLLTTALSERPALRLTLAATTSADDREAIATGLLREELAQGKEMDDAQYRRRLHRIYRKQLVEAGEEADKIPSADDADLAKMEAALLPAIAIPGERIAELESARIEEVKNYLLNVKQLAPERVAAGKAPTPEADAKSQAKAQAEVIGGVLFEIN